MMSEDNPWKTLDQQVKYSNPWITVREDSVICPDGSQGIYGVVETRIATGVLAIDDAGFLYLVGQFRYPTNMYSWELIEGGTDEDESPLDAIKRELQEEAGLTAECWEQLGGEIHLSNCVSSEKAFLFVAKKLTQGVAEPEGTEVLKVRKVRLSEALRMVMSGEIVDSMTIMGILRYAQVAPEAFEK